MAAEFISGHFAFGPYFGPYVCRPAVDLMGPLRAGLSSASESASAFEITTADGDTRTGTS
jgi:hypothetical protein